ncbi:MAG: hypothetical protein RLY58_2274 [Pseudomonadota bacterium]|jgi:hypothetical protein
MSTKARKTKLIKYNIKERGYKHNGQSRNNVDVQSMVDRINGAQTQELVDKGVLYGYYGHDIRKRFGMVPPETAIVDGKKIMLEPALRTVMIKAYSNGDVEHIQEFLDNDSGEFARRQYVAKIGGFSSAQNYNKYSSPLAVTGFYGMDYATQTNYATNVGDGQLFDGLVMPDDYEAPMFDSLAELPIHESNQIMMLDSLIAQTYDMIKGQIYLSNALFDSQDALGHALQQQQALADKKARYEALRAKRDLQRVDDLRFTVRAFDSIEAEAEQFLAKKISNEREALEAAKQAPAKMPKWLRVFG